MRIAIVAAALILAVGFGCGGHGVDDAPSHVDNLERARRTTRQIRAGDGHTCLLARNRVQCWGNDAAGQASPPSLRNPTQISLGYDHTCAIDAEGVKCWGTNDRQQTAVPPELKEARPYLLATGRSHTCVVRSGANRPTCWGDASERRLEAPFYQRNLPTQITAGDGHTCAIDEDANGHYRCWGLDDEGQVNGYAGSPTPAVHVTTGENHSCIIAEDEDVYCWGFDSYFEAHLEFAPPLRPPRGMRHPRELGAGKEHTCALHEGGVTCWGTNRFGMLNVPPLRHPTQLAVGTKHACVIDEDEVVCWGDDSKGQSTVPLGVELVGRHACLPGRDGVRCVGGNERGQLGAGDDRDRIDAIRAVGPTHLGGAFGLPSQVRIGSGFACALGASGAVKCWGVNGRGELGLGDRRDRGVSPADMGDALPALRFETDAPIAKVDAHGHHACALDDRGGVYCWGDGAAGQLGSEATSEGSPARPRLEAGLVLRDLALGREHTCVLDGEGRVYCFGGNSAGQLGGGQGRNVGDRPGTMGSALSPVNLGAGFRVKRIAAGDRHTCALAIDGRVKCWGTNSGGELGLGDTRDRGKDSADLGDALPVVNLGGGQIVTDLACGSAHCCVTTIQNTLKCWGNNAAGQLGLGDVEPRGKAPDSMGDNLSFVATPGGERVLAIDLTAERTCARTESGLRCWGRNYSGELGYGDTVPRGSTPSTVPRRLEPLGL